jgi:hypothetical protein
MITLLIKLAIAALTAFTAYENHLPITDVNSPDYREEVSQ